MPSKVDTHGGEYIRVSARVRPMTVDAQNVKVVFADELSGSLSLRINNDEKRFSLTMCLLKILPRRRFL
uniref:Kinesin motor domain-containing protein n=1 Tax=Ditylenchus dipsaci TaxID=166011 RepID=A0A915DLP1_9BILA